MMTRSDFEDIARVLNANRADYPIVADFADMLKAQNERFNETLFFAAATINLRHDALTTERMIQRHGVKPLA